MKRGAGGKWSAQKTYGTIQSAVRKFTSFVLEIAPVILLELYTKWELQFGTVGKY